MQYISKTISISNLISRVDSNVPYPSVIWVSPVGEFETYQEAVDSIVKTNYPQTSIYQTYTIKTIDKDIETQGNYGNIPLPINKGAMNGVDYEESVPFHQLIEWYWFLQNYYNEIGEDGTAENHYLLETSKKDLQPELLEEAREQDRKVNEINQNFSGASSDRAYAWIRDNLFTNGDEIAVTPDKSKPLSCGYLNIPIQLTNKVNDLGLMTSFDETEGVNLMESSTYHFKVGEVYDYIRVIKNDGELKEYNEPYIITKIGNNVIELDKSPCRASEGTVTSNDEFLFRVLNNKQGSVNIRGQRYDLFLADNDMRYDSNSCDTEPYTSRTITFIDTDKTPSINGDGYVVYPLITYSIGFFPINGIFYEINENRFVTYSGDSTSAYNGRIFPVYETKAHNTGDMTLLYCMVADKKYIARIDDNGDYYFNFIQPNSCVGEEVRCYVTDEQRYIYIDGDYIFTYDNGDHVDITDEDETKTITYNRLKSYCVIGGEVFYQDDDDTILLLPNGLDGEGSAYTTSYEEAYPDFCTNDEIAVEGNIIKVFYEKEYMYNSYITGYTDSRLNILKDTTISVDMLGNVLPGNFEFEYDLEAESARTETTKRINPKYNEPYDGMLLEVPYHIGNVNELEETENGLIGDILTRIEIIGYNVNGQTRVTRSQDVTVLFDNGNVDTFLKASIRDDIKEVFEVDGVVRVQVKFKYSISALIQTDPAKYPIYTLATDSITEISLKNGIQYEETFNVFEKNFKYYTGKDKFYMIKYYDFEPVTVLDFVNDDYGHMQSNEGRAMFKMAVNTYSYANGWKHGVEGFDPTNGDVVSPLYRNELLIGNSLPQNISGNIYIDRGMMSLYERQFKLMDVRTVDALIKSGNYSFKVEGE